MDGLQIIKIEIFFYWALKKRAIGFLLVFPFAFVLGHERETELESEVVREISYFG
jgi:hypothetical protein